MSTSTSTTTEAPVESVEVVEAPKAKATKKPATKRTQTKSQKAVVAEISGAMAEDADTDPTRGEMTPVDPRDSITVWSMVVGAGLPGVGVATLAKALDDSAIDREAKPTDEQAFRTGIAQAGEKAGLRGRALALWVLTGESAGNGATKAADDREAKVAAPKVKAVAAPKRAGKYPVEISEAVRLAKVARGTTNGAPGAKQHVLVREALGKNPTVDQILKAAGVKSEKALRAIADGSSDRESLKALAPFAAQFEDSFCKGRNLASILVAALTQAKQS